MTFMTEPYYKTEPIRLASESSSKYMMPFEPTVGMTDKTSFGVLLEYAIHHSPHRAFSLAISSGVSVGIPTTLQSCMIRSRSLDICAVSYVEEP